MSFLDKLERKWGKFAIPNLMRVIIIAGSLLIIVGASVMGFAMVAEEENF